jgi:predicted nucleic acid-binding protein
MMGRTWDKMKEDVYFFDTYAFFEILKGNVKFKRFEGCRRITTVLNLMELHLGLTRERGKEYAHGIYLDMEKYCVPFDRETIFEANRIKLSKKGLSYIDCIGYAISLKRNILFLTGDRAFKGLPNVEFVG